MGSSALQDASKSIIEWGKASGKSASPCRKATEIFGSLTFNEPVQRQRLPKDVFKALRLTVTQGVPLDGSAATSSPPR